MFIRGHKESHKYSSGDSDIGASVAKLPTIDRGAETVGGCSWEMKPRLADELDGGGETSWAPSGSSRQW